MRSRLLSVFLAVGLGYNLLAVTPRVANWRLPGNNQDYEPLQPVAYSHRVHAGDLQMPCLYCHFGAEKSRHAGIPSANVCMNCHKYVTSALGAVRAEDEAAKKENRKPRRVIAPEVRKVYAALGLDDELQPDRTGKTAPIVWTKVHNLPDFVYFDHRAHVTVGVACQTCHGPVETMERVRQVTSLSMGWCVNCHRTSNEQGVAGRPVRASTACSTCHY
jgi:hypothetical protein